MHGADWIAFPQNYYLFDRLYHKVSLPLFCRKASRIISVSHDATRIAVERLNLPASKVATVYHGFRTDFRRVEDECRKFRNVPDRFASVQDFQSRLSKDAYDTSVERLQI